MDSSARWSASIVDLKSLFSEWERRRVSGARWTRRFREIHSICMFALCLEHRSEHRYLIGFPHLGIPTDRFTVSDLFDGQFGEIEDCDVLLIDDPKCYEASTVLHHRCQLVSYLNQPSTTEADIVAFLERKKLRVTPDPDLRLVIHVEQAGRFNFEFLSVYLRHRKPACPYSQVFVFGQESESPRKWLCAQVYPQLAVLPELTEQDAKALLLDREQYNKRTHEKNEPDRTNWLTIVAHPPTAPTTAAAHPKS